MAEKYKLFHKIALRNLMLHEDTEVDLAKEAITLITGANGSGKTQILDALTICIGHIPSRAKVKGVGSLVGKSDDTAEISLQIANPLIDGRRAITTLDSDLNAVINSDFFTITAKISRDESTIVYLINNSRKIVRGRLITKRDIRRIFEAISVRGENRLAFTGEGTVDEFASKSAKRKLDVLLDVTGLKQYREEIVAARETLQGSIQEIEPLKRKLETENKLLNLWNDALAVLKQKKKLMIMKTQMETELAWSHVAKLEHRLELLNTERLKILKQRSDNDHSIKKKEDEINLLNNRIDVLENELSFQEDAEREKNRQLISIETQLESNRENARNFLQETDRYLEQKKHLEKVLANKDLSLKDRQIQDKQEALAVKQKKTSILHEKYSKIENQLLQLRKNLISEPEEDYSEDEDTYSGERLTKFEEEMEKAAKIFLQKIARQSMEETIVGPIISLIKMKKEHQQWEKAVKGLLNKNLYAFIAKDEDSYRIAKRIYDETWPNWKPPLTVFLSSHEDAKLATTHLSKPQFKEIYDIGTNLLEGESLAIGLLKRMNKSTLAEDKNDPSVLTNIAKISRVNILTKSGKSFYLSYGGFGRPPMPIKNPLGMKFTYAKEPVQSSYYNDTKTRIEIAKLEKERRDLKLEEIATLNEITRIQQDIQSSGLPDEKILGKIETINEIITSIEGRIVEYDQNQNDLKQRLEILRGEFGDFISKKKEILNRIKELEDLLEIAKIELHSLREKSSRLLTLEINYDAEYEQYNDEKKEKEVLARVKGERPEEIRNTADIRDDLNRIEGHLESIGISNIDEEKIEAQKLKVESLKKYMTEREEHITNLRADIQARLAFWNGELQEVITNITRSMKLLLGGIFEKVRLKVTDINNPDEAGLYIEAITKGETYRDFRELSGGEKVLAIEGLILAMHTLTDSPIHAIDEFTQRLDEKNKALAFSIAVRTQKLASESSRFVPQFILLCPEALDVKLSEEIHHIVVSETKVIKVEQ